MMRNVKHSDRNVNPMSIEADSSPQNLARNRTTIEIQQKKTDSSRTSPIEDIIIGCIYYFDLNFPSIS